MYALLTFLHILVCFILILVVLLQTGKGQDLASAFGGGASQTVFGSAGAASALSKLTGASAILFMLTSLGLAIISTQKQSIMDSAPIPSDAAVEMEVPVDEPEASGQPAPGDEPSEAPAEAPDAGEVDAPQPVEQAPGEQPP